ncbi:MAG: hypothetical protein Q4D04_05525 [Clostridia bacterium]|nr:hypothetical protein [Clostridia bacterium]
MKREDIAKLFEGATDEQIKALLDINSADITRALEKRKSEVDNLREELSAAKEALGQHKAIIERLEGDAGDASKLRDEIERYRQAEAERVEAEKLARERAELEARFDAVSGERKYIHDIVRKGVIEDFARALADKDNRGKSDAEIFEALTRDKGYFASQNPPPDMGGIGNTVALADREKFGKMSLYEQFVFANEHPEQAKAFLNKE